MKLNRSTGDTQVDAQEQSSNIPPENNMIEQEAETRERRNRLSSTESPMMGQPTRETPICSSANTVDLPHMNQNREWKRIAESLERRKRLLTTLILRELIDNSPRNTFSLPLENQIGREEAEARERRNSLSSTESPMMGQPARETPICSPANTVDLPHMNQNREQEAETRERRNSLGSTENPMVGEPARETPICSPANTVDLPHMNQNRERIPIAESRERMERLRNGETPIMREPKDCSPGHIFSFPLENNTGQDEAEARESIPNRLIYCRTENPIIRQPTRLTIIYPSGHAVNLTHMNQNTENCISTNVSQERRASRLCSGENHLILKEPRDFSLGHTVSLPLENNIVQEEPDFITDQESIYTICTEVIEELPTNNNNGRREDFQSDVNWMRELSKSSSLPPSYDDVISRPPPSYDETM